MKKALKLALCGLDWQAKALLSALKAGLPALLIGETGTGKTSLVREVCARLGKNVVRVNLDGGTTPDELVGRFQLKGNETYFQHGIIPNAMRSGSVLLLDELNASLPDTLFCIQAVLENPSCLIIPETGETITPAPGFCVVATMNPSHDYAGTKGLNPALYSRFSQVLRFKPLVGKSLINALAVHAPDACADVVLKIAKLLQEVERLRLESKINTRLSIRDGISALTYCADGLTIDESIRASLLDKLEEAEIAMLPSALMSELESKSTPSKSSPSVAQMLSDYEEVPGLRREIESMGTELDALADLRRILNTIGKKASDCTQAPDGDRAELSMEPETVTR